MNRKGQCQKVGWGKGTAKDYVYFLRSRGLEFALLIDRPNQIFFISQHNTTLVNLFFTLEFRNSNHFKDRYVSSVFAKLQNVSSSIAEQCVDLI